MADDIVTRLRHEQRLREPWDMRKEPIFGEAAYEIERLRRELRVTIQQLEAANYEVARLAIDLRDCRRGAARG